MTQAGTRLIAEMDKKHISCQKLADKAGLSSFTVSFARKGRQSELTRSRLARALDLEAADLGPVTMQDSSTVRAQFASAAKAAKAAKAMAVPAPAVEEVNPESESVAGFHEDEQDILTEEQKKKLLLGLFRSRQSMGYTQSEALSLESWANMVIRLQSELNAVLNDEAIIDIADGAIQVIPLDGKNLPIVSTKKEIKVESKKEATSLANLIEEYISDTGSTDKAYMRERRNILTRVFGEIGANSLSSLTKEKMIKWLKSNKKHYAVAYLLKMSSATSSFCNWAVQKNILNETPLRGVANSEYIKAL